MAVIADLDVIANAPGRMAAWGYGDLAGKVVAGADWMLGDTAGEDPIAPEPFAMVQDHVRPSRYRLTRYRSIARTDAWSDRFRLRDAGAR